MKLYSFSTHVGKFIGAIILLLNLNNAASQNSCRMALHSYSLSNSERLRVDFEVKENDSPDLGIIENIDLLSYDKLKQPEVDIEAFDPVSGYTLIIYSCNKSATNNNKLYNLNIYKDEE